MLRRPRGRWTVLAAPAAAAALAGRGSSGPADERLVARAVTDVRRATAAKHDAALCGRLPAGALIGRVTAVGPRATASRPAAR